MTILEMSRDFTTAEKYLLTMSNNAQAVKDIPDGTTITPTGHLTYKDVNGKGEENEMFSIIGTDANGETVVWTCQSQTFKRTFFDMWNLFNGEEFTLKKTSGETKAGRPYVNCDLAV